MEEPECDLRSLLDPVRLARPLLPCLVDDDLLLSDRDRDLDLDLDLEYDLPEEKLDLLLLRCLPRARDLDVELEREEDLRGRPLLSF